MTRTDLQDDLDDYLRDAHSIERQALAQLETLPDHAGEPGLAQALREHHRETEGHEDAVRRLLEERGEGPSTIKDLVMAAGGKGFVLFARTQTDTPGKLATHALSYEALEWASYDLLARTAERAGAGEVTRVARRIQGEERAMMERLESLLDATAEASLEETFTDDVDGHLRRYLADAHALERQSMQLLESGAERAEGSVLEGVFLRHLDESRDQKDALEERLDAHGADPSSVKDALLRLGALNWSLFFGLQPDTVGKLAAFSYAVEYLEIGAYEQLLRVARRAGDGETVRVVGRILEEERAAAGRIAESFGGALDHALAEKG